MVHLQEAYCFEEKKYDKLVASLSVVELFFIWLISGDDTGAL